MDKEARKSQGVQVDVRKIQCIPSRELTYPPKKALLKMIFLFPRWDMLVPWRVVDGSFTTLWCVTEMLSLIVPHYSLKNLYRNKWTVSAGCYSNWFPQKMVVEHFKTVHHRSTSLMAIDSMNAVLTAAVVPLTCRWTTNIKRQHRSIIFSIVYISILYR